MMIKALAVDAAFANMGFAQVALHIGVGGVVDVQCVNLRLCRTQADDKKSVRKSSNDLRRAQELVQALREEAQGALIAFIEVPSGSQSASAARALGIAVGVVASCSCPVIEVSPMEVKRVVQSNPKHKVSKDEMCAWAYKQWPGAPWLTAGGKVNGRRTKDNEHLADAMAAVMAGIKTPEFQRIIAFQQHEISNTNHNRPPPNRPARVRVQVGALPLAK